MTLEEMLESVREATQESRENVILIALNAAQDYFSNRLYPMNKEILKITDHQITISGTTDVYDLGANVLTTTKLYAIEFLGVKHTTDTDFIPVTFVSGGSAEFRYWAQQPAQSIQPVLCVSDNFDQVTFAPPLPDATKLRLDYIYNPAKMDLATNVQCRLPEPVHEAVVSEAKARVFRGLDDLRSQEYHLEALDNYNGAKNTIGTRQFQDPQRTRPSHRNTERLSRRITSG